MATTDKLINLGHLNSLATQIKSVTNGLDTRISALEGQNIASAIRSISASGNSVSFYTTLNATGPAAYTVDFPAEMFLDQTKTTFVSSFSWNSTSYPGSTNPNLNGKPVLVIAVKSNSNFAGTSSVTTYSFVDLASLIDTVSIASGTSQSVLSASGNVISFKISTTSNNALTAKSDGLYVSTANKINTVGSATGNVPKFTATGQIESSGIAASNIVTVVSGQENKIAAFDSTGKLKTTGLNYGTDILTTVANATNYVASFNSSGKVESSGVLKSALITTASLAADSEVSAAITAVFG